MEERKEKYNKSRTKLMNICEKCRNISKPSWDRCNYHCSTGRKIRMLETEYSDITGWSHETWTKE